MDNNNSYDHFFKLVFTRLDLTKEFLWNDLPKNLRDWMRWEKLTLVFGRHKKLNTIDYNIF